VGLGTRAFGGYSVQACVLKIRPFEDLPYPPVWLTEKSGKQLAVGAAGDINLTAGAQSGLAYDETHYTTRGFLSAKTTHTNRALD
jgi:hypothetical protein